MVSFRQNPELTNEVVRTGDPGRKGMPYPSGINWYAMTSPEEDWAESGEMYFHGPIGTGRIVGRRGRVPIWFRDLFPARAQALDELYPEFARQQLAEMARLRGR